MFWHGVEFENADVRHVVDFGQPRHVRRHRTPADVEEDLVGLELPPIDVNRMRTFEPGMAADVGTALRVLQERLEPPAVVPGDLVLARFDFGHVDGDVARADAVVGTATGQVRGMRACHKGFGGDAAVVHAGAARQLAFDDRHSLTGCGQPQRQRRAGLACADDDRVELLCHERRFRRAERS